MHRIYRLCCGLDIRRAGKSSTSSNLVREKVDASSYLNTTFALYTLTLHPRDTGSPFGPVLFSWKEALVAPGWKMEIIIPSDMTNSWFSTVNTCSPTICSSMPLRALTPVSGIVKAEAFLMIFGGGRRSVSRSQVPAEGQYLTPLLAFFDVKIRLAYLERCLLV